MSKSSSRTSSVSNMDDSSRRRPLLAHEREKDSSLSSGDKNDWKSSIEDRSPVSGRRSPVYDKRYSFDNEKSRYEDKQTTSNEKRSSYGDRPTYSSSYRSLYTLNDQRNYDEDKKPPYNKNDTNDDENDKRIYGKKSFDDKRSSHDRKFFGEKRGSYDKTSFDDKEISDKRDTYDKRSFSDKRDSHGKTTEKKSLYDDRKNFYCGDKKTIDDRTSFKESSSFSEKRFPFKEKKSLYDDKSSFYDKTMSVDERKAPVDDWKSQGKDKKTTHEKYDRKSSGSNRRSSDEEWEVTGSVRQSNDRRSPVRERKQTIEIWRPKCERITSVDDKKSDGEWNSSYRRSNQKWHSTENQRKSAAEKVSGEDWDSPPQHSSNNWKPSGDQRRSTDEKKLSDKEWESYQRSNNDRKSFSDQRKPVSEKFSDEKWDSPIRSSQEKISFNDHRKSAIDRLSDEDWESPAHHRTGSNRSIDQRRSGTGARDSSLDRKSLEEERSSSVQNRLSLNDKRGSSGPKKSPDEEWEYSDRHKPFSESKSSVKDKKSSDTWKSYNKKSFGDDRKLSDEEWDPPVHRKSNIDKKSFHDRKSEEWKSAEEEKNMGALRRLSGGDRRTSSNDKKAYLPDISHVLDLIEKAKVRNEEVMTETLCNVEQEIQHCLSHPEYTRVLIMKIVDRSREDQQFAIRAGALFGMIHNIKFGNLSVKAVLLRCVQHYLEEKEHERGEEFLIFNSIFFLSELYYHMRINNLPISILGEALLKHIEPLLLGEETEYELLATCLIVNGSILLQDQSVTLNKIMGKIRSVLIKESLSTKCRGWLLLVIELVSREFAPLLPESCKWYRSLLGSTTFEKFERLKPLPADRQSGH